MFARVSAVLILAMLMANAGSGGTPKVDKPNKLQGTWKLISVDGAEKPPPEAFKSIRIKITTDTLGVHVYGKEVNVGKYKIDAAKKPSEINLEVTVLEDKKQFVAKHVEIRQGIYKLEGDKLTICIALITHKKTPAPATRPTEFKASGDLTILVLERDK